MITIGKLNCDIVIQDGYVSRKHAEISLVDGQYVYHDLSKNGTTINGRVYHNEKVVIAPGTPVLLANKVPLPWPQVLMLLPNTPVNGQNGIGTGGETFIQPSTCDENIGAGWGIVSFLFPVVGFILYFYGMMQNTKKLSRPRSLPELVLCSVLSSDSSEAWSALYNKL